ncbi:unnamed protein product [Soboliphyme baturini]|uniref:Adaptin_N domain-containing protein n=1 Tax=Soboliphyme baturini TaxID=241478 RepID=A0A183IHI7_9BILA|nr:unnamed protein product [Soboliphyme baturini]
MFFDMGSRIRTPAGDDWLFEAQVLPEILKHLNVISRKLTNVRAALCCLDILLRRSAPNLAKEIVDVMISIEGSDDDLHESLQIKAEL